MHPLTCRRRRWRPRGVVAAVAGVLCLLAAAHPARAAGGGVSSGGGTRTEGNLRLTDVVGTFGGGVAAGGQLVLTAGLLPELTGITPVTLTAFTAAREAAGGGCLLEWVLSADSDPAGFHVYRGPAEAGPWARLTERPLPAATRRWVDAAPPADAPAWYRLGAISREGGTMIWATAVTAPPPGVPAALALPPNAPNPFRAATTLGVELPVAGAVLLSILDVQGRLVTTLFDGPLDAGAHAFVWDARADGQPVAAGVYFGRLEALGQVRTRKLLVTR